MKIKSLYNFVEGVSAKFLKQKLNLSFESFRNVSFKELKDVSHNKISIRNGLSFYKDGEDEYLMFYYKSRCYTNWSGQQRMPRYHVVDCETRKEYSGFVYANKMPVDIYSRDESKTYKNEHLALCGNCKKDVFKSMFGGRYQWYDNVLQYIVKQKNPTFKRDGYHSMWAQISEAYRESQKWTCEKCKIHLESRTEREYLHTHHINGNIKDNKKGNFQALCLLCHALEHKSKITAGTGFIKLDAFVEEFRGRLDSGGVKEYEGLKR